MPIGVSRETAQLHAMVIGGLELLESPLAFSLRRLVTLIRQRGDAALEVETRLGSVALPTHWVSMSQGLDYGLHQLVDRDIAEGVEHSVVGRFHHEMLAKRMMGETGQRHIVAIYTDALGKLAWRVAHAKHEKRRRKITYLPVEIVAKPLVEHSQAPRRARHLHGLTAKGAVVYAAEGMVAVVWLHAIAIHEPQRHRRHATERHPYPATREVISVRLLLQPQASEIVGREIHGVAHLQPLRLYGGKHGVSPTKLAVPLVFHWRGLQHHLVVKRMMSRLASPLRARREHERQQDDKEIGMLKNDFHYL